MAVIYKGTQYLAEPGSFFRGSVKIDGDFVVSARSTFWKNLVVTGNLYLCPECQIKGNVSCKSGVISRGCVIDGELSVSEGPVTLCDGADVHIVSCAGDVLVRPGVSSAEISGDTITVVGKIHCGRVMGKKTRVVPVQ